MQDIEGNLLIGRCYHGTPPGSAIYDACTCRMHKTYYRHGSKPKPVHCMTMGHVVLASNLVGYTQVQT